ncbi:MAG: dihydropteroate synthase [Armatimonadota bacterium]
MNHRARTLSIGSPADLDAELEAANVTEYGIARMVPRGRMIIMRLEKVPGKAANLMKQHMLAAGGDVAVGEQVAGFDDTPAPVIVLGTREHYHHLMANLAMQPFGLKKIAEEMARTLQNTDSTPAPIRCGDRELRFDHRTLVMGIINATPDSFSGDGLKGDVEAAVEQAREFVSAGVDILDIGGESTRPGSEEVPIDKEIELVTPTIEAIISELDVPVSIDTSKPEVARHAVGMGASFINDVYGLRRDGMIQAVAETGCGVCIMHMLGEPRTMQENPTYEDLITDIYDFLARRVEAAVEGGVEESQIIIDPGFGFGKTVDHNLEIVRRLREFRSMGRPVLIGASRKSTIGRVLDIPDPQERLWGTAALNAVAITTGADIIRVHDVAEMTQVARMTDAVLRGSGEAQQ